MGLRNHAYHHTQKPNLENNFVHLLQDTMIFFFLFLNIAYRNIQFFALVVGIFPHHMQILLLLK